MFVSVAMRGYRYPKAKAKAKTRGRIRVVGTLFGEEPMAG
jgi:hypothetical protein